MERARLSRTALRKLATEQPIFPIGNGADGPDWTLPDQLDDRTADYVLSVHGAFERLNDAARQVAAVLILKASGASGLRDHPALRHARQSVEEAHAAVRAAEPSPRAAHHHGHLLRSIEAFGDVFSRSDDARSSAGRDTRPALAALRSAADHLRWSAGALPGFEVVALGQGCGCCRPLDRGASAELQRNRRRGSMAVYSIWVLEYAYVPEAAAGAIVYGAYGDPPRKLPYAYILIKGPNILAMVDVGYNQKDYGAEMATRFGVVGWQSPSAVLAEAGISPADVQHILLTHAHFDHAGNTDSFPNATFYLQERELSKWVWAQALDPKFRWLMAATDPSDILRIAELAQQGRLQSIDGDREDVLPGIDLRAAHDTHTWGSQYVTIRNDGQRNSQDVWVMAGDLVYSYDNIVGLDPAAPQYVPIGLAQGSQTNLVLATDEMVQTSEARRAA